MMKVSEKIAKIGLGLKINLHLLILVLSYVTTESKQSSMKKHPETQNRIASALNFTINIALFPKEPPTFYVN